MLSDKSILIYSQLKELETAEEKIDALIDYVYDIRKFNPEEAEEISEDIIRRSKKASYTLGRGRAHNHKAVTLWMQGSYEEGLKELQRSLKYAKRIGYKHLEARVYNNYGNIFRELGDLSLSVEYYEKAIVIYEETGHEKELTNVLMNISNVHIDLFEYENALEYAQRSFPFVDASDDGRRKAKLNRTLGDIFFKQRKFDESLKAYTNSLSQSDINSIDHIEAEVGVGKASLELGQLAESTKFLEHALRLSKDLNHTKVFIAAQFYLGRISLESGELEKAEQHLNISMASAIEYSRKHDIMSVHEMLSILFAQQGEYEKAYKELKAFEELREEILQETTTNRLRHIRTRQEIEVAQKTAKLKQQFMANMSHEIRTPMNAIVGMTRLLLEKDPRDFQKKYLNAISQSADNLLVIINDILDFSKIEAGKIRIEKIPFAVKDILKNVVYMLRLKAEEKGLQIWFELDDNLPEQICGDPTRVTQILLNLAGNAVKFTERGQVDIRAKVQKRGKQKIRVLFEVEDSGIGISEEFVKKIFESFSQAGSDTARKYGGTGLGLAISKQLVDLMDGKIEVKSTLGAGTTFSFTIPFEYTDQEIDAYSETIFQLDNQQKNILNSIHILLVEDNEFNRILAEDVLVDIAPNMKLEHAANGVEAIEKIEKTDFDLVLMDIQMPVLDGVEATRRIRQELKKTELPIVAMTANVMQDDIAQYLEIGMNAHIPKPFHKHKLIDTILKQLKNRTADFSVENIEEVEVQDEELISLDFLKTFTSGNEEKMKKYVNLFLENAPKLLERLNKGLDENDVKAIQVSAHSLKSQLRYLGIEESQSSIQEFEKKAKNSVTAFEIKADIDRLNIFLSKVFVEAQKIVLRLGA